MAGLIVAYAAVVGVASWWVARGLRDREDFLTGRRELTVAHGIGLFGGIFLGAAAVGIVGQGYQRGAAGSALGFSAGLGFVILAFTLVDRMRKSGHASLVMLLRAHYGSRVGLIGTVVIGSAWLVLLAAFIAASGIALGQLTGWPQHLCTAVAVVVLLLYAMPGGMRAVTATNLAHLVALALVVVVVAVLAYHHDTPRVVHHIAPFSWGYLLGFIWLSTPTTVVAPDVLMGIGALRTLGAARKMLLLSVFLLAAGALLMALLGKQAGRFLAVADPEDVLPRAVHLLLPHGLGALGLLVLFGAALTGAVAEIMVCTFILDSELTARRGAPAAHDDLRSVRLAMLGLALVAGVIAVLAPHVVSLVLTAFRVFVPGIVPQAVLALLGSRISPTAVAASMIAGPVTCIAVALSVPGLEQTAADPVLWGSAAAIAVLLAGRLLQSRFRLGEEIPR